MEVRDRLGETWQRGSNGEGRGRRGLGVSGSSGGLGRRGGERGRGSGAVLRVVAQCFLSSSGAFLREWPQDAQCSCRKRTSPVRTAPQTGLVAAAVAVSESVGQLRPDRSANKACVKVCVGGRVHRETPTMHGKASLEGSSLQPPHDTRCHATIDADKLASSYRYSPSANGRWSRGFLSDDG